MIETISKVSVAVIGVVPSTRLKSGNVVTEIASAHLDSAPGEGVASVLIVAKVKITAAVTMVIYVPEPREVP
jgi:hypothetical protein